MVDLCRISLKTISFEDECPGGVLVEVEFDGALLAKMTVNPCANRTVPFPDDAYYECEDPGTLRLYFDGGPAGSCVAATNGPEGVFTVPFPAYGSRLTFEIKKIGP